MIIEGAVAASMYLAEVQIKKVPPPKTTLVTDTIIVKPLPQDKIDKFKEWEKEDWYKDDKNKDMWDKDWIRK
jgi:hypothetical protein